MSGGGDLIICLPIFIFGHIILDLLSDIRAKGTERGIVYKIVDKIELPPDCRLPVEFLKLDTDDKIDNSRKLDKGIEILKDIKGDTSALPEIKEVMTSFVVEQREHNKRMDEHNLHMDEHNKHLEKILEKLAER